MKKDSPKFGEIIKKDKANICNVVLLFAIKVTFTRFSPSFSAKNCLKEEITISLMMIIKAGIINKRLLAEEIETSDNQRINYLQRKKINTHCKPSTMH